MKDNREKTYLEYCVNCGICEPGSEVCEKVCMTSGKWWKDVKDIEPWGQCVETPYYAYATDADVRKKASSGGILTACAIYLLEKKLVDGVLQICVSQESPIKTELVCSQSAQDVLKCCGSRYTMSFPLEKIDNYLMEGKKYAFIGKPCDVMMLKNYASVKEKIAEHIPYMLSFFCAGMPTYEAGKRLIESMGMKEDECVSLNYRGDGWPGYTTAIDADGGVHKKTYEESWGKILGRDIHKCCRVCLDGIGEAADISCADGWYIENEAPDFTEHDGRNVVFARNQRGKELLDRMLQDGVIAKEESSDIYREMKIIQAYQYTRRTTMREKIWALRLCGKASPNYEGHTMSALGKHASFKGRLRIFVGTMKRIFEKKF